MVGSTPDSEEIKRLRKLRDRGTVNADGSYFYQDDWQGVSLGQSSSAPEYLSDSGVSVAVEKSIMNSPVLLARPGPQMKLADLEKYKGVPTARDFERAIELQVRKNTGVDWRKFDPLFAREPSVMQTHYRGN